MTTTRLQDIDVRWLAVAASLLISIYTLLVPGIPNDDAYVYARTAELYLQQGLGAALEHYTWAGYSILIAIISKLGLSVITSALLLNAAFFALLVYSFISIVGFLDASRRTAVLAAIAILVYPELNEYRTLVIRDVGAWAFSLFAVWQLLLFSTRQRLTHGIAFTIALLAAILFRVEAVLYLALMPLVLLIDPRHAGPKCWQLFLRLGSVAYGCLLLLLIVALTMGVNLLALGVDFLSVYQPIVKNTLFPDPADTAELGRLLFGEHGAAFSQDYMTAVIMTGLLVILGMTIFYGISGAYFWLLVYGACKRYWNFNYRECGALLAYAAIHALILVVFLYFTRFLSSRYAIPLCLVLATQVPIVTARILDAAQSASKGEWIRRFMILFFIFCAFDAYVTFGRSKDYLQDAADYVAVHAAGDQGVFTNNHTIAYNSGRIEAYDEVPRIIDSNQLRAVAVGDFVVLEMIYAVQQLLDDEDNGELLEFVTAFPSERDQKVAIFRRVQP